MGEPCPEEGTVMYPYSQTNPGNRESESVVGERKKKSPSGVTVRGSLLCGRENLWRGVSKGKTRLRVRQSQSGNDDKVGGLKEIQYRPSGKKLPIPVKRDKGEDCMGQGPPSSGRAILHQEVPFWRTCERDTHATSPSGGTLKKKPRSRSPLAGGRSICATGEPEKTKSLLASEKRVGVIGEGKSDRGRRTIPGKKNRTKDSSSRPGRNALGIWSWDNGLLWKASCKGMETNRKLIGGGDHTPT